MKFALCQMNVVDDFNKNMETCTSMILKSSKNADFIVLPEMFNCPYENNKFIEYAEYKTTTLNTISKLANENNVYILAGSIPEKDSDNKIYNTSYYLTEKVK